MHYAHAAPKLRNLEVMRMWFAAWNEDNRRAREECDRIVSLLEAPRWCAKRLHFIEFGGSFCRECRNLRERVRRSESGPGRPAAWMRLPEEAQNEIVRLYAEERLSVKRTAFLLNTRESTVRSVLKQKDVLLRTYSEAAMVRYRREPAQ